MGQKKIKCGSSGERQKIPMSKKKTGEGHLLKDDLSNYSAEKYKRPSLTVDIVICAIIDGVLQILLIKRKHPPFRGCWAIPGGFVDIDKEETLDEAAFRELKEETGLDEGVYLEQLKTYGDPHRDPRTRIITVAYYALIAQEFLSEVTKKLKAGDDAKEAAWFPLEIRLEKPKLAFDHKKILSDTLIRLRGKIEYAPIAFSLLPGVTFTWAELQSVYEIILGRKLLASNFRRKMQSIYMITPTGEKKNGFGRPKSLLEWTGIKKNL